MPNPSRTTGSSPGNFWREDVDTWRTETCIKRQRKGWGAAAWMAKAVAESHGWRYTKHDQFFDVMHRARQLSGDARLRTLSDTANTLHGYFYTRKRFLDPDEIAEGLNDVELLLDVMQPLTEGV